MQSEQTRSSTAHIFRDDPKAPEMAVIPAGAFLMGERSDGRLITLPAPFAVGRFPVTFDDWDAARAAGFNGDRLDDRGWGRGRRPVIGISWHAAQNYVAWLANKTGKPYRLLSEAEWEYCCRAGTTTAAYFGAKVSAAEAAHATTRTVEVGSFPANAFGLHDMHGNVFEWCEDTWVEALGGDGENASPRLDGDKARRVVRGGSWSYDAKYVTSDRRSRFPADVCSSNQGFRIARDIAAEEATGVLATALSIAQGMASAGDAYASAGDFEAAASLYRKSASMLAACDGANGHDLRDRLLVGIHERLGDTMRASANPKCALEHYQAALALFGRLAQDHAADSPGQRTRLQIAVGDLHAELGERAAARKAYGKARELMVDPGATGPSGRLLAAILDLKRAGTSTTPARVIPAEGALLPPSHQQIAQVLAGTVPPLPRTAFTLAVAALEHARVQLACLDAIDKRRSDGAIPRLERADALWRLAMHAQAVNCFVEAIEALKRARTVTNEVADLTELSDTVRALGRASAIDMAIEQVAAARRLGGVAADAPCTRALLGDALDELAQALAKQGFAAEARTVNNALAAHVIDSGAKWLADACFAPTFETTCLFVAQACGVARELEGEPDQQNTAAGCYRAARAYVDRAAHLTGIDRVLVGLTTPRTVVDLAIAAMKLADLDAEEKRFAEARRGYTSAVIELEQAATSKDNLRWSAEALFLAHTRLAQVCFEDQDQSAGLAQFDSVLEVARAAAADMPEDKRWRERCFRFALLNGGNAMILGEHDKAAKLLLAATELAQECAPAAVQERQKLASDFGGKSYNAIKGGQFPLALTLAEAGLGLDPDARWIKVNRAHALMLTGKTDIARAAYLEHPREAVRRGMDKTWEQEIAQDFAELRELGLPATAEPFMREIEASLKLN